MTDVRCHAHVRDRAHRPGEISDCRDRVQALRPGLVAPIAAPRPCAHTGAPVAPIEETQPCAHTGAPVAPIGKTQPCAHTGAPVGPSAEVQDRAQVEPVLLDNPGAREQPPTQLEIAVRRAQTKDALIALGWKPAIASAAVATALATIGSHATLDQLIREALRQCPRPSATVARVPQAP